MKFAPQTVGKSPSHTYDTVKDHILQYIQRTYKHGFDTAESLRALKLVDLDPNKPVRVSWNEEILCVII